MNRSFPAVYVIPLRLEEGYGLSTDGVDESVRLGASVLITVDCGITSLKEAAYCREKMVDLIITEMRNTRYRQPAWYRYVAGFCARKPVIVAENPYGGIVPELIQLLKQGKGYDLFRLSLYEAAALGAAVDRIAGGKRT